MSINECIYFWREYNFRDRKVVSERLQLVANIFNPLNVGLNTTVTTSPLLKIRHVFVRPCSCNKGKSSSETAREIKSRRLDTSPESDPCRETDITHSESFVAVVFTERLEDL